MERVRFLISAYLIEVGEERILVDTGLNPDALRDAGAEVRPVHDPDVLVPGPVTG